MYYSPSFQLASNSTSRIDLVTPYDMWTLDAYEQYKKYNTFTPEQKAFRLQKYVIMSIVASESFQKENKNLLDEAFFDVPLDEFAEEWLEHQQEDDTSSTTHVGSVSTSITFNSTSNHFRKNSDGLLDASILKISREKEDDVKFSKTYSNDKSITKTKNALKKQFLKLSSFFRRSSIQSRSSLPQLI